MIRKPAIALAALAVGAVLAVLPGSASAQWGYGGWGHGHHGHHHGYGHHHYGYSSPWYGGYGGYGYGYSRPYYGGVYHDTSHFDYHPGYSVWHGNHYDYVPGHSHWHNSGHWHY